MVDFHHLLFDRCGPAFGLNERTLHLASLYFSTLTLGGDVFKDDLAKYMHASLYLAIKTDETDIHTPKSVTLKECMQQIPRGS